MHWRLAPVLAAFFGRVFEVMPCSTRHADHLTHALGHAERQPDPREPSGCRGGQRVERFRGSALNRIPALSHLG